MKNKSEKFPQARLAVVRRFLNVWRTNDRYREIRQLVQDIDSTLPTVRAALEKLRKTKVLRFDPYIRSAYTPSENKISDALRGILDPKGVHDLGSIGLCALFDAVECDDESIVQKVEALKKVLRSGSFSANITREGGVESGRVDIKIDIRGASGEKFIVFLENKKRDVPEFGKQTLQYQKVLKDMFAIASGIGGKAHWT
jgi:hypothetical protein